VEGIRRDENAINKKNEGSSATSFGGTRGQASKMSHWGAKKGYKDGNC